MIIGGMAKPDAEPHVITVRVLPFLADVTCQTFFGPSCAMTFPGL